jgi:hypothetical protein
MKYFLFALIIIAFDCGIAQAQVPSRFTPGDVQRLFVMFVSLDKDANGNTAEIKEMPIILTVKNSASEDVGCSTMGANNGVSIYSVDESGEKARIYTSEWPSGPGQLTGFRIKANGTASTKAHIPMKLFKKYRKLAVSLWGQDLGGRFFGPIYSKPFILGDLK